MEAPWHKKIETAAFVPAPGAGPYLQTYNTLRFPPQWRDAILRFEREGKNPDRIQNVPIRSLNAAIRALAPDLVSVSTRAAERWEAPWLYTTSEYPTSVLHSLILSWLRYRQPSPDAFRALTDTYQALDLPSLEWDLESVDLLRQDKTAGGTAAPCDYLYRLLPDVLAELIESCRRMTTSTGRSGSTGSAPTTWAAPSSSHGRPPRTSRRTRTTRTMAIHGSTAESSASRCRRNLSPRSPGST